MLAIALTIQFFSCSPTKQEYFFFQLILACLDVNLPLSEIWFWITMVSVGFSHIFITLRQILRLYVLQIVLNLECRGRNMLMVQKPSFLQTNANSAVQNAT